MPGTLSVARTGNQDVDGQLSGVKWDTTSLTYSFPTSASFYHPGYGSGEPLNNFEALNATQQAVVRHILGKIAALTNLTFTEVTESATTHATLRFASSAEPPFAWAYYPSPAAEGGDAWFNNSSGFVDAPVRGNYAFYAFMHEIGHNLGLKHGHETSPYGAMTPAHDSMEYSIMTYRSYVGAPADGVSNDFDSYAQSLMMYDIAALQHMYGADFTTNGGNTTYKWIGGQQHINGVAQGAPMGNKIFMTVWDGGGRDTYDFSNYTSSLRVDLRPGEWTVTSSAELAHLGDGNFARGNIANALQFRGDARSLIEDAIGGAGNDVMIGNSAANRLDGRGGADFMQGNGGNDTYIVNSLGDRVSEEASPGVDSGGRDQVSSSVSFTLPNFVENLTLTGSAAISGTGNAAANSITGNNAANAIAGREGNDVLNGRLGNDGLSGGPGRDFFVFNTTPNRATNLDRIHDFVPADDTCHIENGVFGGLPRAGTLAANAFRVGSRALDGDDRILYDFATGALIHDANGSAAGGATQFAACAPGLAITYLDFVVI